MKTSLQLLAVFLAIGLALPAQAARASRTDAKVKALSKKAYEQYQAGEYTESVGTLLEAYKLKPVPELLFNVARAYDKAGDREKGIEFYQKYLDDEGAKPQYMRKSTKALDRLRAEKARIEEEKRAAAEAERRRAEEAERKKLGIGAPVAPPPPRGSEPNTWAYVATAVGTVGLAAGVGFGLAADNAAGQLETTTDLPAKQTLRDSALSRATFADVGYGLATVAGAVAVWLFLSPPGGGSTTTAGASPASSGPGLAWAF